MNLLAVNLINMLGTGVTLGCLLGVVYIVRAPIVKIQSTMSNFINLILSSVAFAEAVKLFFKVNYATPTFLGNLSQDRITIVLGSIAVVYVSIKSILDILEIKVNDLVQRLMSKRRKEDQPT